MDYIYDSLGPRPNPRGRVWEITFLGSVLLECHGLLNSANYLFQIFNAIGQALLQFSNFYVLPYICFLSLVYLKRWLAEVMFVPSSTLTVAFPRSRHFRVFPQTLPCGLGLGSRLIYEGTDVTEWTEEMSSNFLN